MWPKSSRGFCKHQTMNMKYLTRIVTLWVLLHLTIAEKEGEVFGTQDGRVVQIAMPKNESVSSLLFWTDQHNATVVLEVLSSYAYNITFCITKTNVWHFAYFHQPTTTSPLQIRIPHDNIFVNKAYARLQEVKVSSDLLVHWSFCNNVHACALLPPVSRESAAAANLYLLTPLVVVSLLLLATLVALVALAGYTCYRRRQMFHHYEKPNLPPLPPPALHTVSKRVDDRHLHTTSVHTYEEWRQPNHLQQQQEQQLSGSFDHDSVNSLYGLILP